MEKLSILMQRFGKVLCCTNRGCGRVFTKDLTKKTCPYCNGELRFANELSEPELDSYRSLGD